MTIINRNLGSVLQFSQSLSGNIQVLSFLQTLPLTQNLVFKEKPINTKDKLLLHQNLLIRTSIYNLSFNQTLFLNGRMSKGPSMVLSQVLNLYHFMLNLDLTPISNHLNLNQTLVIHKTVPISSNLNLVQILQMKVIKELSFAQTLDLQSGLGGYIADNDCLIGFTLPTMIPPINNTSCC